MDKLKQFLNRFDELNIKERGLILIGAVLLVYMLWDMMFLQPINLETSVLQRKIESKSKEVLALRQQSALIVTRSTEDPDAANKAIMETLNASHQAADLALSQATEHLIASERMSQVLEELLIKTAGLKFISMKGLGVSPLITPLSQDAGKTAGKTAAAKALEEEEDGSVIGAFKHGLQIEFEGGYHETLAYLKALEALQWSFFWHSVDYSVGEYPNARTRITVYTLSLKDGWIDV